MPTAVAIDGSMEFQKNLIPSANVTDGKSGTVAFQCKALLQAVRQAATKQGFVGNLIIEPACG